MTFNAATIDPVTTEVVASRLRETAATMEYALYHSGYSPILRELKDGTAGLTDPEGRVVIISGGLQYHFTAYQQAVQAVLARYPAAGLKPGESFVSNDPYKCGSPHAPDFVAVTPAFHQGVLLGFGVSSRTSPISAAWYRARQALPRARSITMACCCRRCASRPRPASRS